MLQTLLTRLIQGYRMVLSPLLPPTCRFTPTCPLHCRPHQHLPLLPPSRQLLPSRIPSQGSYVVRQGVLSTERY